MQSFQSLVFDGLLKFATGDNFLLANNFLIVLNFFRDFDQQHLGMTHRSKRRNFHYTCAANEFMSGYWFQNGVTVVVCQAADLSFTPA